MVDLPIDPQRLKYLLDNMANFGALSGGGISRRALSEPELAARQWLTNFAQNQQLKVWLDEAANLHFSCNERIRCETGPVVMTGSHIDSVPEGGVLDGTYGVLAGIEVLCALQSAGINTRVPLEVVAFTDEEGRFGGMLGSQAMTGLLDYHGAAQFTDESGISVAQAYQPLGLNPQHFAKARRDLQNIQGFVELHIEQGPRLENANKTIGVVHGICGLYKIRCRFQGVASHAGTTPMDCRRDALSGATELHQKLPRLSAPDGVATVGSLRVEPGAPNVIPSTVTFTVDMRHLSLDALNQLKTDIETTAKDIAQQRGLSFHTEQLSHFSPMLCDDEMIATIQQQAKRLNYSTLAMPSGAAHDALNFRHAQQVGMIFVPSVGGLSHNTQEYTAFDDLLAGVKVLSAVLMELTEKS